jgi:hypothetical protein
MRSLISIHCLKVFRLSLAIAQSATHQRISAVLVCLAIAWSAMSRISAVLVWESIITNENGVQRAETNSVFVRNALCSEKEMQSYYRRLATGESTTCGADDKSKFHMSSVDGSMPMVEAYAKGSMAKGFNLPASEVQAAEEAYAGMLAAEKANPMLFGRCCINGGAEPYISFIKARSDSSNGLASDEVRFPQGRLLVRGPLLASYCHVNRGMDLIHHFVDFH